MEVGVELKFSNGSGCIEWNFDKGSMYNGSVKLQEKQLKEQQQVSPYIYSCRKVAVYIYI